MDKQFEAFINDLGKALAAAAGIKIWEIPMEHRTKDSISAYRSAVGMVGSVVMQVLEKHRTPAATPVMEKLSEPEIASQPEPEVQMQEPVVETPVPNSLFGDVNEAPAEGRRRRRNTGENDAA